jgi:hypothetical protein
MPSLTIYRPMGILHWRFQRKIDIHKLLRVLLVIQCAMVNTNWCQPQALHRIGIVNLAIIIEFIASNSTGKWGVSPNFVGESRF